MILLTWCLWIITIACSIVEYGGGDGSISYIWWIGLYLLREVEFQRGDPF